MKKILITGGLGMIGQAIAQYHERNNDEVFIYDTKGNEYNNATTYKSYFGKLVGVGKTIKEVIDMVRPELISHHASKVGVAESQYKIAEYSQNNNQFTADLLDALVELKYFVPIIFAGSMSVYGEGNRFCPSCFTPLPPVIHPRVEMEILCPKCGSVSIVHPTPETYPHNPLSIYGSTKTNQENLLRIFGDSYGIPVTSLRYFSVYGTRSNPLNPNTGILQIIVNKLLNSDSVILNEDGEQIRDMIHCDDIAKAHYIMSRSRTKPIFTAFNIATGKPTKIKEIVKQIQYAFPIQKPILYNHKVRIGDVRGLYADVSKILTTECWVAGHDLNQDIREYCDWVWEHKEQFIVQTNTCDVADNHLKSYSLFRG